jgi:hypothetical protein
MQHNSIHLARASNGWASKGGETDKVGVLPDLRHPELGPSELGQSELGQPDGWRWR